jgi:LPS-assembly protein
MRWWILGVLLGGLALLPVVGSGAVSQRLARPGETANPGVVLRAETLEYTASEKRLVATGAVTIVYGETRLFADHVELNTQSGVGSAWGKVRLLTPEDDIRASRLDFELSSERGVLYEGRGIVARSYIVAGKRIARLGPQSLSVHDGRITTCTGTVPDWEFRAREARIGLGDYVSLKHPSFWIKGVPVFYVPYFVFPLKDQRATGFLPPRLGGSRRDGAMVGTEFYWALADWMDATLGLEYLSKKGWRPQGEFRYAIAPLSDGQLRGSFIHEQDTGKERWKVLIQQRQEFGWDIRGLGQLDLRSKPDLDRRFARDIALESAVQTASFGLLTKRFADSSLTVAGELFQAIRDSGSEEAFRRLPRLSFTQFPTSILGIAFFAVEASYSRLSDTVVLDEAPVQRLDFFPRLTLPLALPPWMRLTFTGGARETFYDRQMAGPASVSRHLFDLRAHLQGPVLRRRYRAFVHLIEPRIAYRYVAQVRQDDIPPFETLDAPQHFLDPLEDSPLVDRIAAANYVKVSLTNSLFAGGGQTPGQAGVRQILRLVISQGLDMRRAARNGGALLGPLDVELEMHLWQRWRVASTVRLAPATGALQKSAWHLELAVRPGWLVRFTNQYRRDPDILYFSGGMQVALREGLQVGYTWRYDGRSGAFREHLATLRYRSQCWGVDVRFRWRQKGDTELSVQANLWRF